MIKSIIKRRANKCHICGFCKKFIEGKEIYTAVTILDLETNRHVVLKYHNDCFEERQKSCDAFVTETVMSSKMEPERDNWDRAYQ